MLNGLLGSCLGLCLSASLVPSASQSLSAEVYYSMAGLPEQDHPVELHLSCSES